MSAKVIKIAEYLLKIQAVRFQPKNPYTWASGWRSPVYCDNRLSLSYPEVRTLVRDCLVEAIREHFPEVGGIAGVATAGIPQGALVADQMNLPFIYIRSAAKKHGLTNQIEGQIDPEVAYVVIEDLVSTGGSSLKAIESLQAAGGRVMAAVSVFNYGFPVSKNAFAKAGIPLKSLLDLNILLAKAVEINYIQPENLEVVKAWRDDPEKWSKRFTESTTN